ncbi:MAG: hypothetical protein P8I45_02010 [Nitrospinaceae bacterium]|jgi:hypothetical protein|nr:hypothetical protein [Nitrospinaceae bacterium]
MRKNIVTLLAVFFVFSVSVASANVSTVKAGGTADCLRAGWVIENLSETKSTTVHIDLGIMAYSWKKNFDRTIAPGDFLANAANNKATFTNKGPADISLNCQRTRVENANRHEWKKDAGSQKTYQSNYHLDHVRPGTYIEPGMGQPEGTERGLFSQTNGQQREGAR